MPHVELALAAENLGNHRLGANLWQIALVEAVFVHEMAQHLMTRRVGDGVVGGVVGRDQVAHLGGQAGEGVMLGASDFVQQFIQVFDQSVIVGLALRGRLARFTPRGRLARDALRRQVVAVA